MAETFVNETVYESDTLSEDTDQESLDATDVSKEKIQIPPVLIQVAQKDLASQPGRRTEKNFIAVVEAYENMHLKRYNTSLPKTQGLTRYDVQDYIEKKVIFSSKSEKFWLSYIENNKDDRGKLTRIRDFAFREYKKYTRSLRMSKYLKYNGDLLSREKYEKIQKNLQSFINEEEPSFIKEIKIDAGMLRAEIENKEVMKDIVINKNYDKLFNLILKLKDHVFDKSKYVDKDGKVLPGYQKEVDKALTESNEIKKQMLNFFTKYKNKKITTFKEVFTEITQDKKMKADVVDGLLKDFLSKTTTKEQNKAFNEGLLVYLADHFDAFDPFVQAIVLERFGS